MKEPKDYKYFTEGQKREWDEYVKAVAEYEAATAGPYDHDRWDMRPPRPIWDYRENRIYWFAANH